MSEELFASFVLAMAGFGGGYLVCYAITKRESEKRFEDGFRLGRSFDGFDDWLRENYGDRYGD